MQTIPTTVASINKSAKIAIILDAPKFFCSEGVKIDSNNLIETKREKRGCQEGSGWNEKCGLSEVDETI